MGLFGSHVDRFLESGGARANRTDNVGPTPFDAQRVEFVIGLLREHRRLGL
jgi:hypothetical protein